MFKNLENSIWYVVEMNKFSKIWNRDILPMPYFIAICQEMAEKICNRQKTKVLEDDHDFSCPHSWFYPISSHHFYKKIICIYLIFPNAHISWSKSSQSAIVSSHFAEPSHWCRAILPLMALLLYVTCTIMIRRVGDMSLNFHLGK